MKKNLVKQNMDVYTHAVNKQNLPRYKCVIFIKKNYDFTNNYICCKLLNRYGERTNKQYICKDCHQNLKHGVKNLHTQKICNSSNISKHQSKVYSGVNEQNDEMITEMNESNELQNKTTTMCVCCQNIIILQHNTLDFEQQKYLLKGKFPKILQSRTIDMTTTKYICNACDLLLRNGWFPVNILQNSLTLFFCGEVPPKIFYTYDENIYENNAFSKQLEFNNMSIDEGSIICEKCHKLLINKCQVKCSVCGNMNQRKYTYVCDREEIQEIYK